MMENLTIVTKIMGLYLLGWFGLMLLSAIGTNILMKKGA